MSRSLDDWHSVLAAVGPRWTEADVCEEAADMWLEGWSVACRGGTLLLVTPEGRSVGVGIYGDPAFGLAVWERLLVVEGALLSRGERRQMKKRGAA